MAEVYPSDNELLNLISEAETGVEYIATGQAPYYLQFRKLLYRLLEATRRANDLRVYDEGGLEVGVKAGAFLDDTNDKVSYAGSSGNSLTDNATNYLYLDSTGLLVINTTGFPATTVVHLRLATVVTSAGDITSITDERAVHFLKSFG